MNSVFANLFSSQTITPASFLTILFSMVLALLAGLLSYGPIGETIGA